MSFPIFIGLVSGIVNVVSNVPYVIYIIKGQVKPHRVSFGLYAILTTILLVNQIRNDGGYSVIFNFVTTFNVVVIFLLSINRGMGGASRLDVCVLLCATVLFVGWALSQDTRVTTFIAIAIDFAATIPTVIKAYRQPETEIYFAWIASGSAGLVSVFAITEHDYILYLFPLYIFVMNLIIVGAKKIGHLRLENQTHSTA